MNDDGASSGNNEGTDSRCPRCGAPGSSAGPGGHCLGCLLKLAFAQAGIPAGSVGVPEMAGASATPSSSSKMATGFPRPFGNYLLLGEISRGGMGVIFRAQERSTNRVVALKMMRSAHLATEAEVKRFQTEAEAAASLVHPNLVPVHDVNLVGEQHYFTMRLFEGGSLADALRGKGPAAPWRGDPREAARLLAKVARAVDYAHQRGVLHRDLKPSNILLDAAGEPHVSDFGLAKLMQADSSVTLSEAVLGTAPYMSPEQAAGHARLVTMASDIWALGVILYELLTGRLPFTGENHLDTLRRIQEGDVASPRELAPQVPVDLALICLKCLMRDPAGRYASAGALAEDLERWLGGRPVAARAYSPAHRAWLWARHKPLKAALVLLAVASVIGPLVVAEVYLRKLPHMATLHPVIAPDHHGNYPLNLWPDFDEDRATYNFYSVPFRGEGKWIRLEVSNAPLELASQLEWRIRADQAGAPDPARTPVLRHGSNALLRVESERDRSFYVASVGRHASNILQIAPAIEVRVAIITNGVAAGD